ncbi:MAG TPA: hypothetical protein VFS18_03215, partial [Actinomycetota bacterium]|nr:hypothetical protein [Actinomycetota bacterium]
TTEQGTARTVTRQTMTFEGEDAGTLTMSTAGVIDFDRLLQSATMTSRGTGTQAEAIAQQTGTMTMVSKGLTVYFKSSLFQQVVPGAKEWMKMDMQAVSEEMGMDLGSLMPSNQGDPTSTLSYLAGVENVEEVGREEIHGVETTHYRGRATWESLKNALEPDAAATIEQLETMMDVEGFDVDAWIDDENVARRLEYDYDALPMPGMDGTWSFLMEFYDFGIDVDVKIPPAHKVTDLMEVMQDLEGQ